MLYQQKGPERTHWRAAQEGGWWAPIQAQEAQSRRHEGVRFVARAGGLETSGISQRARVVGLGRPRSWWCVQGAGRGWQRLGEHCLVGRVPRLVFV